MKGRSWEELAPQLGGLGGEAVCASVPDAARARKREDPEHPVTDRLKEFFKLSSKKLGEGTDGVLYKALALATNRAVCVKVLTPFEEFSKSWEEDPNQQRELDILVKCKHPHVVPVLQGFHPIDGVRGACFAMPERECSMHQFLDRRQGGLRLPLIHRWGAQLCRAVAHCHALGYIHRDVKPANMLLRWDDNSCTLDLELADFGRARVMPTRDPARRRRIVGKTVAGYDDRKLPRVAQLTVGRRVCTPGYSAPEMWCVSDSDDKDDDDESILGNVYGLPVDVWAIGAVIYEWKFLDMFVEAVTSDMLYRGVVERIGRPLAEAVAASAVPAIVVRLCGAAAAADAEAKATWTSTDKLSEWLRRSVMTWDHRQRLTAKAMAVFFEDGRGNQPGGDDVVEACASSPGTGSLDDDDGESSMKKTRRCTAAAATTTYWTRRGQWLAAFTSYSAIARPCPAEIVAQPPVAVTSQKKRKRRMLCTSPAKTCQCNKHCGVPGHKRNGCTATARPGSQYCDQCGCAATGCNACKRETRWCSMHGRIHEQLPWALSAAARACDVLDDMMPCDLECFVEEFPNWSDDWCLVMLGILLKEPIAVKALSKSDIAWDASQGRPLTHNAVWKTLRDVARAASSQQAGGQWALKQITRQGVARFMGLASVLQVFGVAVPSNDDDDAGAGGLTVELGVQRRTFRLVEESDDCPEALKRFVDACNDHQPRFREALERAAAGTAAAASASQRGDKEEGVVNLGRSLADLAAETGVEARLQIGNWAATTVARKVVIAVISMGRLGVVAWDRVTMTDMKKMMPDRGHALDCFPGAMPASQASCIVFGRHDRAVFLSMWSCLFSDKGIAANKEKGTDDEATLLLLDKLASGAARQAVSTSKLKHDDIAPCPNTLCDMLVRQPAGNGHETCDDDVDAEEEGV